MLEILKNYEGIIGTLSGVIITTIINFICKRIGRIEFYIQNFIILPLNGKEEYYTKCFDMGAKSFKYTFDLQISNTSEQKKFIRNPKLKIYFKENKESIETDLKNLNKIGGAEVLEVINPKKIKAYEIIKTINLNPREAIEMRITGEFSVPDNVNPLPDIERTVLTAIDDKNKKYEILINRGKRW